MKILRVITRMNIGGPALQAVELTKRLKHQTVLLYGQLAEGEEQFKSDIIRPLNKIETLVRQISPIKDFKTFLLLRDLIKYHKPDVIHTHMSKAGALTRLAAITVKNRPKLVHTFHGTVLDEYFGWFKSFVFKRVERFFARYTDALIAISPQQHRDITRKYRIARGGKVKLVRLGFDLSLFNEVYHSLKKFKTRDNVSDTVIIGIVGRIAKIKNHAFFIEILSELKKLLEKDNRKLEGYVIGGGVDKDVDELKQLAKDKNVRVVFYDYLPHDYMALYYSMFDLVLCTSRNEGTPVSLIEAMATGTSVESTNVGGVPDVLGRPGLLFTDDSPRTAADEIYFRFFRNGKTLCLPDVMQKSVVEKYDINRLVYEIDNLYKELIRKEVHQ